MILARQYEREHPGSGAVNPYLTAHPLDQRPSARAAEARRRGAGEDGDQRPLHLRPEYVGRRTMISFNLSAANQLLYNKPGNLVQIPCQCSRISAGCSVLSSMFALHFAHAY